MIEYLQTFIRDERNPNSYYTGAGLTLPSSVFTGFFSPCMTGSLLRCWGQGEAGSSCDEGVEAPGADGRNRQSEEPGEEAPGHLR